MLTLGQIKAFQQHRKWHQKKPATAAAKGSTRQVCYPDNITFNRVPLKPIPRRRRGAAARGWAGDIPSGLTRA
jgi:hypothetical protein